MPTPRPGATRCCGTRKAAASASSADDTASPASNLPKRAVNACLAVGGASPRKSLPQWMHEAGHSVEEISDVGGWALRRHLGAVHTYFKTTLQQQLAIKRALRQRLLAVAVQ